MARSDESTADIPFHMPGTGFAAYEFGDGNLFVSNEGHDYLVGTRVRQRADGLDSYHVSTFDGGHATGPLHLTLLIGKDRDDVVDFDEYEYVILDRG